MNRETSPHVMVDIGQISDEKLAILTEFASELPTYLGIMCFKEVALCFSGQTGRPRAVDGELSEVAKLLYEKKIAAKLFIELKPNYLFYNNTDDQGKLVEQGIIKTKDNQDSALSTAPHSTKIYLKLIAALVGGQ